MLFVPVRQKACTKEDGMLAVFLTDGVNRLVHLGRPLDFGRDAEYILLPCAAVSKMREHNAG